MVRFSMYMDENYDGWKIGVFKNTDGTYTWSASSDTDDISQGSKSKFRTPDAAFENAKIKIDEFEYSEEMKAQMPKKAPHRYYPKSTTGKQRKRDRKNPGSSQANWG